MNRYHLCDALSFQDWDNTILPSHLERRKKDLNFRNLKRLIGQQPTALPLCHSCLFSYPLNPRYGFRVIKQFFLCHIQEFLVCEHLVYLQMTCIAYQFFFIFVLISLSIFPGNYVMSC